MDSKATLDALNGKIDIDSYEWITITKCSDDNDDEGYKGIVFLNDDETFQRMMGGGNPNSTWPYRNFETVFDRFLLNWNIDVKMDNTQKQTIGENAVSFFQKTKEDLKKLSENNKPSEETESKPEETESKPSEETESKPEETESKPEETESKPEETGAKPEETGAKPEETGAKQTPFEKTLNSFMDYITGKDTSRTENCKKVKVLKEEQNRHRVIVISKKINEKEREV